MTEELLSSWQAAIAQFDERLLAIARRPVDLGDRDWPSKIRAVLPLDEAGIRADVEALLEDIIRRYAALEEPARQRVREMFRTYASFGWAAGFGYPPTTNDSLRKYLILESIRDQGLDPRDAGVSLEVICHAAHAAGVRPRPVLLEIAAISSAADPWRWGSMRQLMMRAASRWRWRSLFW